MTGLGEGPIDWQGLARRLGLLRDDGESGSTESARRAVELLLGEDAIRSSVEHYVTRRPGSELARSVLWLLRPWSAMERCYEIYRHSDSLDERRAAVELLRVAADRRALAWVAEFLSDPDAEIQKWGMGVIDQLYFSSLADFEEIEEFLSVAERHPSEAVRSMAASVRENEAKRAG